MNKVILLGRLTRDPEVRYSNSAEPVAFANYGVAVNRKFKRAGEPDADFINCVAIGKAAEFAEKYFKKGMLVCVSGRLQVRNWEDQSGQKRTTTEVVLEEQDFAESKGSFQARSGGSYEAEPQSSMGKSEAKKQPSHNQSEPDGFYPIDESVEDDDLPF